MIPLRPAWWLAVAAVAVAVLVGAWWLIDSRARLSDEVDRQQRDLDAWERVGDADLSRGDPDDDRSWLREWLGWQQ